MNDLKLAPVVLVSPENVAGTLSTADLVVEALPDFFGRGGALKTAANETCLLSSRDSRLRRSAPSRKLSKTSKTRVAPPTDISCIPGMPCGTIRAQTFGRVLHPHTLVILARGIERIPRNRCGETDLGA